MGVEGDFNKITDSREPPPTNYSQGCRISSRAIKGKSSLIPSESYVVGLIAPKTIFDPDRVAYFMRFDSFIVFDSAGIIGNSHTPGCGFKPAPRRKYHPTLI
jgi:hypothetical protein